MSWGNKLMFVFIVFALFMGTMVYKAVDTRFDLVTKNYYKDELRFQEQIDAAKNASQLAEVEFFQDEENLFIIFPASMKNEHITTDIWMYCKADVHRDKKLNLSTDSASLTISKKKIFKGNFEIKVKWSVKEKEYYSAKDLIIL